MRLETFKNGSISNGIRVSSLRNGNDLAIAVGEIGHQGSVHLERSTFRIQDGELLLRADLKIVIIRDMELALITKEADPNDGELLLAVYAHDVNQHATVIVEGKNGFLIKVGYAETIKVFMIDEEEDTVIETYKISNLLNKTIVEKV